MIKNILRDPVYKVDPFLTEEDTTIIPNGMIKITYRDNLGAVQKITTSVPFQYKEDVVFNNIYLGDDKDNTLGKHFIKEIKFISEVKEVYSDRWFISNAYLVHGNRRHKRIDHHPNVRVYIPFGKEVGYCIMPHRDALILDVANEPNKLLHNNIYEIDYDLFTTQNLYYRERVIIRSQMQEEQQFVYVFNTPVSKEKSVSINKECIPFNYRIEQDIDKLKIDLYS